MTVKKISDKIFAFHVDIAHDPLFEGMWCIPSGVTLNSYLVKGEKTALIDFVRDWEGAPEKIEAQCGELGVSIKSVDYLILNHLEPDHTAFLPQLKKLNPKLKILATEGGIKMAENFFSIKDGLQVVKTEDSLDLGGIKLNFIETPNLHWPETMMTYEPESKTLFSCDAFGSYGKTGERIFDDEFSPEEHKFFEHEALRYYANIIATFSFAVEAALEKLKGLPVKTIAPSHGLIWRKSPERIVELYARFASYNSGNEGAGEREVFVIITSMYGNTKCGALAAAEGVREAGVPVKIIELPPIKRDSPCPEEIPENANSGASGGAAGKAPPPVCSCFSEALAGAFRARGLILAMPTYEYKMFPLMENLISLLNLKHVTGKTVLRIGSWGWSGGAQRHYDALTADFDWKKLPSYEWQGVPREENLAELKKRGRELAEAL